MDVDARIVVAQFIRARLRVWEGDATRSQLRRCGAKRCGIAVGARSSALSGCGDKAWCVERSRRITKARVVCRTPEPVSTILCIRKGPFNFRALLLLAQQFSTAQTLL